MRTLNSVILVGQVASDPVFRSTPAGRSCELSLGIREVVRTARGDTVHTEWIRVRLGPRAAALSARTVRSGGVVGVEGRLRCRTWQDDHGRLHKEVFVQGHRVHVLGAPGPEAPAPASRTGERRHPAFRAPARVNLALAPEGAAEAVGDGARRPLRAG